MTGYIGIKRVEAKPMNLGDYNAYKGWTIPENEDPATEGYLVKYADDYISWSPAGAFEEAYTEEGTNALVDSALGMASSNYVERFIAEYRQISDRVEKLGSFLKMYRAGTLDFEPNCPLRMLEVQLSIMNSYKTMLESRAQVENITL